MGIANAGSTVTVNSQATYRTNEYYRAETAVANSTGPAWTAVNVSATRNGTTVSQTGNLLTPPATQTFQRNFQPIFGLKSP
jgi:hypothetical protein